MALAATLLGLALLTGCQSLGYYAHAVKGQVSLLRQREPVPALLRRLTAEQRAGSIEPARLLLLERLRTSQQILDFAESHLSLPVGDRYRSYVGLDRPAVVWNLFAAPELSLEPHRWCYPWVGCAPYRGFFDQDLARREGERLQRAGYDVYLGGVAAYSTLGWFADPLLSTFIAWPEASLAELLFHELAHGVVWVAGDVRFNESFATFVGRTGLAEWLESAPEGVDPVDHRGWERLIALLQQTREVLERVYRSAVPDRDKFAAKADVLAAARQCYRRQRARLGGGRYDPMIAGLNNALLVSVSTYQDQVPAFSALFEQADGSWPAFYALVEEIAALPVAQREARLHELARQRPAPPLDEPADAERACEIQWKT